MDEGDTTEVIEGELLGPDTGKWRNFDEMAPEERREMAARSHETRRRKREARKLAELEAYIEAHREHAQEMLGAKLELIVALRKKGTDPATGEFDPSLLGDKFIKVYLQAIDLFERRAFGNPVSKTEQETTQTNVLAIVADLRKELTKGD